MDATTLLSRLQSLVPEARIEVAPSVDMPTLFVAREHIVDVARALRETPGLDYTVLVELTAADYLPREPRFEVIYQCLSLGLADFPRPSGNGPAARARLKVQVPGDDPRVPTVAGIWTNANWLEREVLDLYGLTFDGHPDPRRLIMPEDWDGHPLRKDYPVQVHLPVATGQAIQVTEADFLENIARQRAFTARRGE